jgi:GT2 family glycosyltransferase
MARPRATVAFVPREVFSTTQRSLETLFERTHEPFDLVCVDGHSPPAVRDYLEREARARQFTLIRTDGYVTPNQARNLAAQHVKTPYVVFMDNDVLVTEGWLSALVNCAEETGAWVVGPLYFEFLPEGRRLHMFGGECQISTNAAGERVYYERHHHAHELRADVAVPLTRQPTQLIEFHTVLVDMRVFRELGPLDEGLLCNAEHGDLCLTVMDAGHTIWIEPSSQITYAPPKRLEPEDEAFFLLRWSEAWAAATHKRIDEKWNLTPGNCETTRACRWVADHRRYRLVWLNKLRKRIGLKWAKTFEKRFVAPFESLQNRRRYPLNEYAQAPRVTATIVRRPTQHDARAA